jgi:hypothetical protein
MKNIIKLKIFLGFFLFAIIGSSQTCPNKSIRILEPTGPGSDPDAVVRDIIPALNDSFG